MINFRQFCCQRSWVGNMLWLSRAIRLLYLTLFTVELLIAFFEPTTHSIDLVSVPGTLRPSEATAKAAGVGWVYSGERTSLRFYVSYPGLYRLLDLPELIDLSRFERMCAEQDYLDAEKRALNLPRNWYPAACKKKEPEIRLEIQKAWNEPWNGMPKRLVTPNPSNRQILVEFYALATLAFFIGFILLRWTLAGFGVLERWILGPNTYKAIDPSAVSYKTESGTVISVKIWSETHVSSSSNYEPGEYIPGQGYRAGRSVVTSVSSRVVRYVQFFVRFDDGQEQSFTDDPTIFPVREGNRVSIVWATSPGARNKSYWLTLLHNHDLSKSSTRSISNVRGSLTWKILLALFVAPFATATVAMLGHFFYQIAVHLVVGDLYRAYHVWLSPAMTASGLIGALWSFVMFPTRIALRQWRADKIIVGQALEAAVSAEKRRGKAS